MTDPPSRLVRTLTAVDAWVHRGERALLCVALGTMIAVVFADFALVQFGAQGWPWAKEAATYSMVWVGFLGASLAVRERKHLKVDASEKLVPRRFHAHMAAFVGLVAGVFCFILVALGWKLVSDSMRLGTTRPPLELPLWIPQAAIPVSAFLMGTRFLVRDFGGGIHRLLHPAPAAQDPLAGEGP